MKTFSLILLIGIIIFSSCNKEDYINDDVPKVMENYNFYKSANMYNDAQESRSDSYSDAFEIEKVERTGNKLNVTLTYQGNCDTNKFDVVWDGILLESYPMQTNLIIKRSASNCTDEEINTTVLSIDLVELIDDKVLVEGTVFHVSNASKIADEANADVVVTHVNE